MKDETLLGGRAGNFPATRHSAIHGVRSADPQERTRAFDAIVASYWKPIYKHLRLRWKASNEEAKDLTQGFLALALEKAWLERYEPERARFRTYLRACLDGFVSSERAAGARLKRGGGRRVLSFDFEGAETELARVEPADGEDPDERFRREWTRELFGRAIERLRAECEAQGNARRFALFERYDLAGESRGARPTYAELAEELGIPATQVTNGLFAARRAFRGHVLDALRSLTGSEDEFRDEARALFGDGAL